MPTLRARDSVGRNASAVFTGQVLTWVTTAITFALIPRYLGAHDVGVYAIGVTFWTLATAIAGLGMGTLITRDVARDREGSSRIVATAIWLNVVLGVVAAMASIALAWLVGYSRETILVVAMLAATVPLSLIGGVVGSILTGLEIMRWNAAFDVATKVLFLVGAGIALFLGFGIVGVITASVACSMVLLVCQLLVLHRVVGTQRWAISKQTARYLLVESTPFFLVSISWVMYTSVDVFLLSWLSDEASVGVYTAPMRLFGTALFLPVTITTVLFPRLSATYASDASETSRLAGKALRFVVSVSVLMALASVALSDPSIVRLLGESFADDTGPVVLALSISLVPTSISIVASRMAFAANRQSAVAWIGFSAFAGKAALGFLLIPYFNAEFGNAALGAAVVLLAAESTMVLAMLRFLPGGTFAYSGSYYRRLGLATSVAACACVIGYGKSPLGASLVAGACYVLLLALLRLLGPSQVRTAIEFVSRRAAPDASPLGPPGGPVPALAEPEGLGLH